MFPNGAGEPLNLRNLARRNSKDALKRAGLPLDFRVYDLRHTYASRLIADGHSPKLVQQQLGHSDVRLTLEVYSHVMDGMDDAAAQAIDEAFFG